VRNKIFSLSLIAGLFFFTFIFTGQMAGAEQPENILERELTSHPISDGVPQTNVAEGAETYTQGNGDGKSSPEKEVQIRLDDNLKAFFSFGAPSVRDLSGAQEDVDYRATVGINIPL